MTADISVSSMGNSLATTRVIISLNPKIPTKFPSSTTNAAFLLSAILVPASKTLVPG